MKIAHVTLHVGLGTFRPVKVEDVTQHHMHSEFYVVEEDQAKLINDTKAAGGRVIAVGTTSCRTLESATGEDGILKAGSGWTEIFIYPGYKIQDPGLPDHKLPSSGIHTRHARVRTRRTGTYPECISGGDQGAVPVF